MHIWEHLYVKTNVFNNEFKQDQAQISITDDNIHTVPCNIFVVPRVSKGRMGVQAFSYQALLLWNQLPVHVQEADSISTFKTRLKTFLIERNYCNSIVPVITLAFL